MGTATSMGTPTSKGAGMKAGLSRKARVSQEWRRMPRWGRTSDHRSSGVVKLVMGLHHGSPRVVKLEVGLHQGCYIREHEVSQGGEASNGASPPKIQESEVHDGTSPWEFQGA